MWLLYRFRAPRQRQQSGECATSATTKDYCNAHCDHAVAIGGTFGHILLANGVLAKVTATDAATAGRNKSVYAISIEKVFGSVFAIKCTSVEAAGTVRNNAGGTVTFGNATTTFRGPLGANQEFCEQEPPAE